MLIKIDNKPISLQEIDSWRYRRIKNALSLLKEKKYIASNVDDAIATLTEVKKELGSEEIIRRLRFTLAFNTLAIKIFAKLSKGKRKFAIVEVMADGISAERVSYWVNKINLNEQFDEQYTSVNLHACPDHYVLRCTEEKSLEVVECNGNFPTPFQFYIKYGDETGLNAKRDESFPYQSVGAARTKDGIVIGGVRHQFKDTDTGFMARLCVEFPSCTPSFVVKSHRIHMAAEFSYWLQWIIDNKS